MKRFRIIIFLSVMVIILIFCVTNHWYISYTEQQELKHLPYYELYSSYYQVREEYRMFLMVHPQKTGESSIGEIFTEDFIRDTITKFENTDHGTYPIQVYLIAPSEELPYGWEKSELNISANFDQSAFHRNTYCRVTIPFDAETLQECAIEWES